MGSKYKAQDSNIYVEDTDIPKNKLGINSSEEIHELERELLEEAYVLFFKELEADTLFDETYFQQLHKRTFSDLYEWAGVYRSFNMSKGDSRFCQGAYLSSSSQTIFKALAQENYLKDYASESKDKFANRLAYYKSELIALHPFYEINGRITRMFFDMIAVFNGYKYIDYSHVSSEAYIASAIECVVYADSSTMEQIIYDGLEKVN